MSREQPTFPFQKLDIYVAARELVVLVGRASVTDRELRDQLTRASASVLLRLSEGLPHRGQGLRQKYFAEAQGSLHEVAAALDVAAALGRLDPEVAQRGLALAYRVRGMILGLQR